MTLENYLQEAGALATLSGILAGFAFSAVVQFLASERQGKLNTAVIVVFSLSTLMFLFSLVAFVMGFATAAELNDIPPENLDWIGVYSFLVLIGALYLFLAGIGIAGWMRSRAAGIATTFFSIITMCLTAWVIFSAIAVFME
jgi:hypothetical protein